MNKQAFPKFWRPFKTLNNNKNNKKTKLKQPVQQLNIRYYLKQNLEKKTQLSRAFLNYKKVTLDDI